MINSNSSGVTFPIFFPSRWMEALVGSRNSRQSTETVRAFLDLQDVRKDYPVRLRRIILQSADDLFRATEIVGQK